MTDPLRSDFPAWNALMRHARSLDDVRICDLFAQDPARFNRFHVRSGPLLLDFSKQRMTAETLDMLCTYARACDLEGWRAQMFAGARINTTEDRAVLHTALRAHPDDGDVRVDGCSVLADIQDVRVRMQGFSENVRTEKRFTDIVNIGIGGSDLGTLMAYEALKPFTDRSIRVHFVSNVDAAHLEETLRMIDPEKTLCVVVSKTFTTQETMTNAHSMRNWLRDAVGQQDVSAHFAAVTQNADSAVGFGVAPERIFPVWDWVGGRFSLCSAVGLPLCIALGYEQFSEMLEGARDMDRHFLQAPFEENMPVLLGLTGLWNRNFLGCGALAVVPYSQYLHRFPAYIQQLDMESNGKSVDRDGRRVPYGTGPVVFGEPGTNAQHAFFQLLHQGTESVPCEFIVSLDDRRAVGNHQAKLLANALAQAKALMDGRADADMPQAVFEGNRPSTMLVMGDLTPRSLGMLIALYEHKIFVQGVLWHVNSFDQCGVELGKVLAGQILDALDGDMVHQGAFDSSTQALSALIKQKG